MKIHLSSSGGFANLRLEGAIDTADLPKELAARAEKALGAKALAAAGRPENRDMADGEIYELTVLPEDEEGEVRKHRISRAAADPELMELLGEVMAEITRRKAEARKKAD